jgi:hypothetical protein
MAINFTQQDDDTIANLYDYSNLTEQEWHKAQDNFTKLIEDNEAPRFLYIIRCLPNNFYKIGITNDIYKRIEDHQTGCPFKLKFIFAIEADESDFLGREIVYMEKFFHKNYENLNIRGEWFELTEIQIAEMCLFLESERDFDILEDGAEELKSYFEAVKLILLQEGEEDIIGDFV